MTAERARSASSLIADELARVPAGGEDPSLAGGHAGLAVLYGWRVAVEDRPADRREARRHLEAAVAAAASEPMDASLWSGFPGVAWAVDLVERWLDGEAAADRTAQIEDVLAQMLERPGLWPLPHDLVSGAVGATVYLLERHRRRPAPAALQRVLDRLEGAASSDGQGGRFWWTAADQIDDPELQEEYPNGYGDLGLAHGQAGPIGLLGHMLDTGVGAERARPLLEGAVAWLRRQALTDDGGEPTYPLWVAPGLDPSPARSAWCYGDPGVAAAVFLAAGKAGRPDWAEEAVGLARRAAARPDADTGVDDVAFCHGAAGLAHVYNRLYQASGDQAVATAARHWLDRTLAAVEAAAATGPGWVAGGEEGEGPWEGLDIVDGAAGVALVLLAATTGAEPVWDRMFLLS